MVEPTVAESAYYAGFFDGEGCVAAYNRKYVVSLTNTDIRPLKRAVELWGGFISSQSKESRKWALQDLWRWQIYGQNSRAFLAAIRPYTVIKTAQIDAFVAILDVLPSGHGKRRGLGAKTVIDTESARLRLLKRQAS